MKYSIALFLFVFLFSSGVQAQETVLALQWSPQAQFAGYYMALEKGYYLEHGIDLRIISGGPGKRFFRRLDTGKADFATLFLSTAVERAGNGVPIVNVAQIVQESALMIVTRKDSGINGIEDLHEKKITMWGNEFLVQPKALFNAHAIRVIPIPLSDSLALFLRGGVQATMAMWYNEYHTILASGIREDELRLFFFRDTAYNFPEDGIYCRKETFQQDPEAALNMARASLEGWRYAFAHEEETLAVVEKHMRIEKLPVTRAHQRWMLRKMKSLIAPRNRYEQMGCLDAAAFENVTQTLEKEGYIGPGLTFASFYKGALCNKGQGHAE